MKNEYEAARRAINVRRKNLDALLCDPQKSKSKVVLEQLLIVPLVRAFVALGQNQRSEVSWAKYSARYANVCMMLKNEVLRNPGKPLESLLFYDFFDLKFPNRLVKKHGGTHKLQWEMVSLKSLVDAEMAAVSVTQKDRLAAAKAVNAVIEKMAPADAKTILDAVKLDVLDLSALTRRAQGA